MSAKYKAAKIAVEVYKDALKKCENWVNESLNSATSSQIRVRIEQIKANHDSCLKNISLMESEDDAPLIDLRAEIDLLYFYVYPSLEDKLEEISREKKSTTVPVTTAQLPNISAKLPEISLTSFSGDLMKWSEFSESFTSLVDSNKSLSTIAKFQYLKHSLKDAAANAINSLDFTEANYEIAKQILKDRFNQPNRICEHHIKSLFCARAVDKPCSTRIMELLDTFNSHLRSLKTLKRPTEYWDDLIVYLFLSKLDGETKEKWYEHAPNNKIATFDDLSTFLKTRCSRLELMSGSSAAKIVKSSPNPSAVKHPNLFRSNQRLPRFRNQNVSHHALATNNYYCLFCDKSSHSILRCLQFLKLSIADRISQVAEKKICANCLRTGHVLVHCSSTDTCKLCKQRHHTLLHESATIHSENSSQSRKESPRDAASPSSSSSVVKANASSLTSTVVNQGCSYVFLATALVEVSDTSGNPILGRALLDSGSQLNFISRQFASKLRLPIKKSSSSIGGIGTTNVRSSGCTKIELKSLTSNYQTSLDVMVLPSITDLSSPIQFDTSTWSIPVNLQLADPKFISERNIDILIGAEIYFDLLSIGQVKLGPRLPSLQNTVLGWIVSGRAEQGATSDGHVSLIATSVSSLEEGIEKFWKLESVPEGTQNVTTIDHPCDQHFVKHVSRDESGRFVVRLPFVRSPTCLGNSSTMALRRFYNLERKLLRNTELRHQYQAFIDEYIRLGHMELVPDADIPSSNYYMPHHCVLKPDSSSTKLRVVFDGSAKASSGLSLNDILMVGPVIQNDLVSVLSRFRCHRYAFSTDITKMYRQVRVHSDDCNYQMIFWRNHPDESVKTYRLLTVTYGTSPASFLSTRCLVQCADESITEHPFASAAIKSDMYVDDMLTGANTISSARQLKSDIIKILESAGMELRKWCANSPQIINDVPLEHREQFLKLDDDDYIKTLGIFWQPTRDVFQFHVQPAVTTKITKRIVISEIARLFDPLGFVAPVVILGKLFMQKLWKLKVDWDEALPVNYFTYWSNYRKELSDLNNFSVPRYLFDRPSSKEVELHGFADASESAFGAVIYTRCCQSDGTYLLRLVCSKSRVAPLQKTTLPRLELSAALLLAQLMSQIRTTLNFEISGMYYWTDSTIALHWIRATSADWKTFVANRVASIQQLSDPANWYHIPSKENPADIISRGLMPNALMSCKLWFSGPPSFQNNSKPWLFTIMPDFSRIEPLEHKKPVVLVTVNQPTESPFATMKYTMNNYRKLIRVMSYAFRFLHNCRSNDKIIGEMTNRDFEGGLTLTVRMLQEECFPDLTSGLKNPNFVVKSASINSLTPFLDDSNIIRVGGRIQHSSLPYHSKHPILVPFDHPFSRSLMVHYHLKNMHVGPQGLLAAVRDRFWPMNGRRLSTQTCKKCVLCARARPTPANQLMGSLPLERVEPTPAFQTVGIDYCGPFYLSQGERGKPLIKSYLCIFVCFSSKAFHLEVVSDLTTKSFLGALRRFSSVRGLSKTIFSDNGKNFCGANSELKELYNLLQSSNLNDELKKMCQEDQIVWKFAPPDSPHFGGLYEAGVKSVKYHLRRVMGSSNFTYEELHTAIKQVEAILNSRPIAPMTSTPDEINVLTPGHLLIGRPLNAIPEPKIE